MVTRRTIRHPFLNLFVDVVVLAAAACAGYLTSDWYTWPAVAVGLLAFILLLGHQVKGGFWGALVDERGVVSLSRFQMLLWMVIILSAFLAMTLARIRAGEPNPLSLDIPAELLALIGIGTTSLVAAPLIRSGRTDTYVRRSPADGSPSLWDMFRGEQEGNSDSLDLAKVQMFFFTLVAAVVYCVLLFGFFRYGEQVAGVFPRLDDGFLWVLGISNGGYLVDKRVTRAGSFGVATCHVMRVVRKRVVPRQPPPPAASLPIQPQPTGGPTGPGGTATPTHP